MRDASHFTHVLEAIVIAELLCIHASAHFATQLRLARGTAAAGPQGAWYGRHKKLADKQLEPWPARQRLAAAYLQGFGGIHPAWHKPAPSQ